jgi:nucleotide-binding universal stress UspA family protein
MGIPILANRKQHGQERKSQCKLTIAKLAIHVGYPPSAASRQRSVSGGIQDFLLRPNEQTAEKIRASSVRLLIRSSMSYSYAQFLALPLVATDGSDGADRAIDYAARWAKHVSAELLIVNIIGGYGLPNKLMRTFTQAQHAWLDEMLQSLSAEMLTKARDRAQGAGVAVILLDSRSGDVAQSIINIAKEKTADVIVVGKRGAGHVAGVLIGSVSQKLVSLAPLPVVVVP